MLISLLIENFRSFGDEQELSAVANGKHQNLTEHLVEIPGHSEKLVPVVALYGANGAGKSNVVRAVHWLRRQLMHSDEFLNRQPHAFSDAAQPTRMVLRILAADDVYEYGVSVRDSYIQEEWLSEVSPGGATKPIFERATDAGGKTTIEYGRGLPSPDERLRAHRVLGVTAGALFLARLSRDGVDELPQQLRAPFEWFVRLQIVPVSASYGSFQQRIFEDAEFREDVVGLLRRLQTGVDDLASEQTGVKTRDSLTMRERESYERTAVGAFARRGLSVLVKTSDGGVAVQRLRSAHRHTDGRTFKLPFEDESDGTQRVAHLAPALHEATNDSHVFIVDELDRSLHAVLVKEFLREFLQRARGHRSQLIFTTHETHALDQELLRRDEVWFVEKNKDGASELYSLDDFPVRTDLKLDRSYLQGRFGAVPNLRSP